MMKYSSMLILTISVISCASFSPINLSDPKSVLPNEAIVFGRVEVVEGGKAVTSWGIWGGLFQIFIQADNTSRIIDYALSGDGTFYWHLTPGNYTIIGFDGPAGMGSGRRSGRIFARFTIPRENATIYIGTLTLNFMRGLYSKHIKDDYDLALESFKKKFPGIKGDADKSLMQLEKPL